LNEARRASFPINIAGRQRGRRTRSEDITIDTASGCFAVPRREKELRLGGGLIRKHTSGGGWSESDISMPTKVVARYPFRAAENDGEERCERRLKRSEEP